MTAILVVGETVDRDLDSTTAEIIAAARGIRDDVTVVLLGTSLEGPAAQAIGWAWNVWLC